MYRFGALFFSLILLMFIACNSATDKSEGNAQPMQEETHGQEEHGSHEGGGQVALNNGEKWQADASTNQGIADMKAIMVDYHEGNIQDIDTLQGRLTAKFQEIFAKCSMEGEAHTQLHNYLLPLKNVLQQLKKCEGKKCGELVNTIDNHLKQYTTYFK